MRHVSNAVTSFAGIWPVLGEQCRLIRNELRPVPVSFAAGYIYVSKIYSTHVEATTTRLDCSVATPSSVLIHVTDESSRIFRLGV